MALTVGTDSYIAVADADTYFLNRLYADAWTATTADDKERALKMATRKIDMQPLIGRKADLLQSLQFPRALYSDSPNVRNVNYDPLKNNMPRTFPGWVIETEVSQDVKDALCEEALAILKGAGTVNKRAELQRQGVTSFSLGGLSETFSASSTPYRLLSLEASMLLARYIGGTRVIV